MAVSNIVLVNTHHAHWGGFAAKKFKIRIQWWENRKVWNEVYNGTMIDPTGKVIKRVSFKIRL